VCPYDSTSGSNSSISGKARRGNPSPTCGPSGSLPADSRLDPFGLPEFRPRENRWDVCAPRRGPRIRRPCRGLGVQAACSRLPVRRLLPARIGVVAAVTAAGPIPSQLGLGWTLLVSARMWARGLGHEGKFGASIGNNKCPFTGTLRGGSDGTRTRDLRRDRPSRARRRPPTSHSKRPHLQVLSGSGSRPLRMVEPIVESTFGPRVGHEILCLWTTQRAARGRFAVLPSHDPSGCLTCSQWA
jgi:hypothetical protein